MGTSSSTLKRTHSTPVMAYGRIRVHDSPQFNARTAARRLQKSPSAEFAPLQRTYSEQRASATGEQTPLVPVSSHHAAMTSAELLGATHPSPPLLLWIVPALCCALAYGLYNIFIKKGSNSIHPVLGGVILQFVAALLGCCLLAVIVWRDNGWQDLEYDREGIQWSICAGLAVGVAEMVSFFVSGMGVQAMQSIPIIIGGSVMFGTLMGFLVLQETLGYQGWCGVALLVTGICLVGTDPAASSGE